MKLEIRDKYHAQKLERTFHDREVIEFHGVSMLINECQYNFDGRPSWSFGFREIFTLQLVDGGKPPVGTICEYTDVHGLKWYGCEIIAYHGDHVWIRTTVAKRDHVKVFGAFRFRPLRTAEQIAAEERDRAIATLIQHFCADGAFDVDDPEVTAAVTKIYDAGYRKQ